MEDIAAATGVPNKAALYHHFEGKDDILAFLFTKILDEVAGAVDRAAHTDGTASERLRDLIVSHLGIEAYPAASRALRGDIAEAILAVHDTRWLTGQSIPCDGSLSGHSAIDPLGAQ